MSKDKVVVLESSKINVLFDGKRIKVEGSNLLKNKLSASAVTATTRWLVMFPALASACSPAPSSRWPATVSPYPLSNAAPLPGNLMAELKRETEMCIKLSNLPNGGISASSSLGYES